MSTRLVVSTKEISLAHAKNFAEDWYLGLCGKNRAGILKVGKTFREAAMRFLSEFEILTSGECHAGYIDKMERQIRVHLNLFFGDLLVTEITPGVFQEYRIHRMTSRKDKKTGEPKRPSRSTLHHETVTIRHILKTANRHG